MGSKIRKYTSTIQEKEIVTFLKRSGIGIA